MSLVFHYIIGMVPYCLFGVIICAIGRIIYYRRNNKKIEWKRELLILLFVAYCVGLASQTVIPRWDAGIDSGTGKPYFDIYWIMSWLQLILFRLKQSGHSSQAIIMLWVNLMYRACRY